MKTLLLCTDFSTTGDHAVKYGYHLAQSIKANVVVCHAFMIPAEVPQVGVLVWPMDSYEEISHDNEQKLNQLKAGLKRLNKEVGFQPAIKLLNETGPLENVIRNATNSEKADMVIVGTHHPGMNSMLLGNHNDMLLNYLAKQLLFVPPDAKLKAPQKIAFASDFKHPDQDMQRILSLMPLIRALDAELYITHIQPKSDVTDNQPWLSRFLTDIARQATYPKVFSRIINDDDTVSALKRLCTGRDMDLLVMVHHRHGFFESLFKGSYTKKIAKNTKVPLLALHATE